MPCILSTLGVLVTRFWSLSSLGIEFFRETFVFTYFFLYRSSGPMRDQSSQFVPNSGLHVAGEKKICFHAIIFKGVNFIVNRLPLMCEVQIYAEGQNTLIPILFWYTLYWYSLVIKAWWKRVVYERRSQRNTCKSNKEIDQIYNIFLRQVYPCSAVNKHGHEQYTLDPCQK